MADDVSDEDKELFRQAMRTVKPLHPNKMKKSAPLTTRQAISSPIIVKKPTYAPPSPPPLALSDYCTETVDADSVLSFGSPLLPLKRFKQLKNGKIHIDARLDLHGLKIDRARAVLCSFIDQQTTHHHRCLLIIHGKGGLRGDPPVLKNLVHQWLKQFPEILAFHSALARDGGPGAVYVLLKRSRSSS